MTTYTAGLRGDCRIDTWMGDYGVYRIPERFANVKFRRNGAVDKRQKAAVLSEFLQWVADEEKAEKERM